MSDGYQALFFQKYWALVGANVSDMVIKILHRQCIPPNLNETFLVLIPKVKNPSKVSQFWPISLCNGTYKLITKVIVQRLKEVLPLLISPSQASFIPQRQINDNIIIMQEVLHTMKKKKGGKGLLVIKIDLEKAYDHLNWAFIRDTLIEMGLPTLMVETIMSCVLTCSMRLL